MANSGFSKLFLFALMLAVYSKSSLLTMALLSLYGLVHGVASVPEKRASAMKSLIRYGAKILLQKLGSAS